QEAAPTKKFSSDRNRILGDGVAAVGGGSDPGGQGGRQHDRIQPVEGGKPALECPRPRGDWTAPRPLPPFPPPPPPPSPPPPPPPRAPAPGRLPRSHLFRPPPRPPPPRPPPPPRRSRPPPTPRRRTRRDVPTFSGEHHAAHHRCRW